MACTANVGDLDGVFEIPFGTYVSNLIFVVILLSWKHESVLHAYIASKTFGSMILFERLERARLQQSHLHVILLLILTGAFRYSVSTEKAQHSPAQSKPP